MAPSCSVILAWSQWPTPLVRSVPIRPLVEPYPTWLPNNMLVTHDQPAINTPWRWWSMNGSQGRAHLWGRCQNYWLSTSKRHRLRCWSRYPHSQPKWSRWYSKLSRNTPWSALPAWTILPVPFRLPASRLLPLRRQLPSRLRQRHPRDGSRLCQIKQPKLVRQEEVSPQSLHSLPHLSREQEPTS